MSLLHITKWRHFSWEEEGEQTHKNWLPKEDLGH